MRAKTPVLILALVSVPVVILLLIGLFLGGWFLLRPAAADAPSRPESAPITREHVNEALGYALRYPEGYSVVAQENGDVFVIGTMMNHSDPRLEVTVSDAEGATAQTAVDTLASSLADFDLERHTWIIDGIEAEVVDGVPGQESSRVVFLVHEERLYELSFTYADESLGDAYAHMEELFLIVADSFQVIPVASAQMTRPSTLSPAPTVDVPLIMNRGAPANDRCVAMIREPGGHTLKVRSGPGEQHAVAAQLMNWAVVRQSADGWHEIEIPQGGTGWVDGRYVILSVGCEAENW